jgi:hypothetical protein
MRRAPARFFHGMSQKRAAVGDSFEIGKHTVGLPVASGRPVVRKGGSKACQFSARPLDDVACCIGAQERSDAGRRLVGVFPWRLIEELSRRLPSRERAECLIELAFVFETERRCVERFRRKILDLGLGPDR